MEPFRVLVIDDEASQRDLVAGFLAKQGIHADAAASGEEGIGLFRQQRYDLILSDVRMAGLTGLDVLRQARAINPEVPVVLLTAYGSVEMAVQAMKEGAADFLTKPVDLDELLLRIGRAREQQRLASEVRALKETLRERYRIEGIIGESGRMQEVLALVHRVSASNATVLIRGESGTGKELVARAIHYNSPRAGKPYVAVNCAALPETLLESELFGHERGAFTGAAAQRKGRFELADGGTLFLDEIGDLPQAVQVKLLRVLQERAFERLGSTRTIRVDVRIIAATHRDLEGAMREGRFRDDLYYRLNVVPILIPPLRERREDIPPLIDHFARKYAEENAKPVRGLTREARDILLKYDYPGNVRELENILERAVVLCRGEGIGIEDLPLAVQEAPEGGGAALEAADSLPGQLEGLERRLIAEALEQAGGIQTRAAEILGVSERVLRYKLRRLGLTVPRPA